MAGSFGYKFIWFSALFYLFLGFILVSGGAEYLVVSDLDSPLCTNATVITNWFYYTNFTESALQNLPYSTRISGCLDCDNYTINFINSSYYATIYNKINATWFSGVQYEISGVNPYGGAPYNSTVPWTYVKWVYNTSISRNVSQDCTGYRNVNSINYQAYLLQNPFSELGWLFWLSLAIMITNLYILITSVIP